MIEEQDKSEIQEEFSVAELIQRYRDDIIKKGGPDLEARLHPKSVSPEKAWQMGLTERVVYTKRKIPTSVYREQEEVYRIAAAINRCNPNDALTFIDKYNRHFLKSNFFKKSNQTQLVNIFYQLVEYIKENKNVDFRVYVVPSNIDREIKFEDVIYKLRGYNKESHGYLNILVVPYASREQLEESKPAVKRGGQKQPYINLPIHQR